MEKQEFNVPSAEIYELNLGERTISDIVSTVAKKLHSGAAINRGEDQLSEYMSIGPTDETTTGFQIYFEEGSRESIYSDDESSEDFLGDMTLHIPALASRKDIEFALQFLREAGHPIPEGEEERLWQKSIDLMKEYLTEDGVYYMIEGFSTYFRFMADFIKKQYPEESDLDKLALQALLLFKEQQTASENMEHFGEGYVSIPKTAGSHRKERILSEFADDRGIDENEEEAFEVVFVSNKTRFGQAGNKKILIRKDSAKIVDNEDFFLAIEGNKQFRRYDMISFSLEEMQEEEWESICDAIPGKAFRLPKTFLLRWNPAISSFKLKYYQDALKKYGQFFAMDWSVWDWKEAAKGDKYFMLREGDGVNPGIIFKGEFLSDPYEGDDWRGTDQKRYYVDIDCEYCSSPDEQAVIPTDVLDKELPDYNWHLGHSGEVLPKKIAKRLEELFDDNILF